MGEREPWGGERSSPFISPEPCNAQDWFSKCLRIIRAQLCARLSWFVFSRRKVPSNFRFSCCWYSGFLRREHFLTEFWGGRMQSGKPASVCFILSKDGVLTGWMETGSMGLRQILIQTPPQARGLLDEAGPKQALLFLNCWFVLLTWSTFVGLPFHQVLSSPDCSFLDSKGPESHFFLSSL